MARQTVTKRKPPRNLHPEEDDIEADPATAMAAEPTADPKVAPAPKAKLDRIDRSRKRDIGTVFPPVNGAHFFQSGPNGEERYFDAEGMRVMMPGDTERDAAAAAQRAATQAARAKRLREEAAMLEEGIEPEKRDEDVIGDDINLTAWGLEGKRYRFAEVRKAIERRYQRVVDTEGSALDFLMEVGCFTEEQFNRARRRPFRVV